MDVPRVMGYADAANYPWDWDDESIEQFVAEHHAELARKRPVGFQARWPEDGGSICEVWK